jgi:hypothetical protein
LSTAPERAGLAEVIDDTLVIEPLSRTRLPLVIQQPAQRAGLQFAPGLVEQMVEETTGGDALPLLDREHHALIFACRVCTCTSVRLESAIHQNDFVSAARMNQT